MKKSIYAKAFCLKMLADLHIHSKYSRATSKSLDLKNLEKYARIKGIELLGTGDFTHPVWLSEIKSSLREDGTGFLKSSSGFPFVLSSEISLMYSQGGKGRRIHLVVLAPDVGTVEQVREWLLKRGRLDYDGRPVFGIPCPELTEALKSISDKIEIIPAHIWTPWFSLFGSNSGFDSIQECFQDQARKIHAVETGLSSDPPMNWRLSQLDDFSIVSFSDSHSFWPWRIGREATDFNLKKQDYDSLIRAIREQEISFTVEVDPSYGKYHYDGHRACGVRLSPKETRMNKGLCPVCRKPLTVGVLSRVEELADRPEGYSPKNRPKYYKLLPLSEILSGVLGTGMSSKKAWSHYNSLVREFGSEYDVLLRADEEMIGRLSGEKIAEAIMKNRIGRIEVIPGYDGEYGRPVLFEDDGEGDKKQEREKQKGGRNLKQASLTDF